MRYPMKTLGISRQSSITVEQQAFVTLVQKLAFFFLLISLSGFCSFCSSPVSPVAVGCLPAACPTCTGGSLSTLRLKCSWCQAHHIVRSSFFHVEIDREKLIRGHCSSIVSADWWRASAFSRKNWCSVPRVPLHQKSLHFAVWVLIHCDVLSFVPCDTSVYLTNFSHLLISYLVIMSLMRASDFYLFLFYNNTSLFACFSAVRGFLKKIFKIKKKLMGSCVS